MSQISGKVEALLTKHPTLSQEEAIKIITDKNERKKKKRHEKSAKSKAKDTSNTPDEGEA